LTENSFRNIVKYILLQPLVYIETIDIRMYLRANFFVLNKTMLKCFRYENMKIRLRNNTNSDK